MSSITKNYIQYLDKEQLQEQQNKKDGLRDALQCKTYWI